MGRPRRDREGEDRRAAEAYEADRTGRSLRVLRPMPRRLTQAEEEASWAAKSGPVRVRERRHA